MDRFSWGDAALISGEKYHTSRHGLKLYDGENVTAFQNGELILTSHRMLWKDTRTNADGSKPVLCLDLSLVVFLEAVPGHFKKSPKIIVHLSSSPNNKQPGPVHFSPNTFIKLSFTDGGCSEYFVAFNKVLSQREWEKVALIRPQKKMLRTGISGIQREIQKKHEETNRNIADAFKDLSMLMNMAKDMVTVSRGISNKIRESQGSISENETIQFKSYLLSLGISDPITKDSFQGENEYYNELAKQIALMMERPIKEAGGIMTLTDVYCWVNRARGLELLSPEDLFHSCNLMEKFDLPLRLKKFDTGVLVLQHRSDDERKVLHRIASLIKECESVTADELSRKLGISVILSKERLLGAEKAGIVCRDDSVEGLRFYANLFLSHK